MLGRQPRQPGALLRPRQLRARPLGQGQEVGGVAPAQGRRLVALGQPLQRILADRLQHHEARPAVHALCLPQQALIDQRSQLLKK